MLARDRRRYDPAEIHVDAVPETDVPLKARVSGRIPVEAIVIQALQHIPRPIEVELVGVPNDVGLMVSSTPSYRFRDCSRAPPDFSARL